MADDKDLAEFPDLSSKLAAPTKKSLFERQREEAEAKRKREEAETAAVYSDFVKSFEDEDNDTRAITGGFSGRARPGNAFDNAPRGPGGPSKRHFAPAGRNSGPGSLGPPPNLSKKRAFDGSRHDDRRSDKSMFAFDESSEPTDVASAFRTSRDDTDHAREDREAERAAARPTLQLSSLPPGTSPAVIKSIVPPLLTVEGVRLAPPAGPGSSGSTDRKSMSAIVTLAAETPATDIDTVASSLQNKYLGWGFNLSISRHLSSAALNGALNTTMPAINSGLSSLPFNAQPVHEGFSGQLNRAPPPETHRGGIAPPSSYGPRGPYNRGAPPVQVRVNPPSDIKQLKLVHKTVESMLTHGPEFEALLMSRPEVQKEEKWAWIWNPRSPGGIYYRWRLWEVLTGGRRKGGQSRISGGVQKLFDGAAMWAEPDETLPFEFTTNFDEMVSDSDYNSSDEENSDDEDGPRKRQRQFHGGSGPPPEDILNQGSDERTYLNPMQRAKLTHLLARLPETTAKLRKGDVAQVTAFAISHAGQGADEVVEMLVSNVLRPFCWSKHANPEGRQGIGEGEEHAEVQSNDNSPAIMVALHCISDILSASSTSGVRHAWRYRSLFEASLSARKVFAFLGQLEATLKWGRLRAEKWKRSINNLLQLWEGWSVFPVSTQENFADEFNNPPKTKEQEDAEEHERRSKEQARQVAGSKKKWKAVEVNEAAEKVRKPPDEAMAVDGDPMEEEDVDGRPMDNLDGAPMEDLDGAPMDDMDGQPMDEGVDGQPMVVDAAESEGQTKADLTPQPPQQQQLPKSAEASTAGSRARPARMKAEDMFADSDED